MLRQFKLAYVNNQNSIRMISFSLISVLLLILTWIFDYGYPQLKDQLPQVMLLSKEVSTSFLSNLSGVFLTVTTFTFTTILTILNHYASTFSPRILQDFIEKPNVLSLFGIFIGGFFYTVLALFFLSNLSDDVMMVSGTIGVFYAIASMIAFILFVRRVLKGIRVDDVIETIYQKAYNLVNQEAQARQQSERYDPEGIVDGIKIYGKSTGYFYDIDSEALKRLLGHIRCELVITQKIGDYIPKGMYLATLNVFDKNTMSEDEQLELVKSISDALVINIAKNDQTDYHLEISYLIEVALRALSPGINDPSTAVSCIDKLALLLGRLFSSQNHFLVLASDENTKIIYKSYSVEEEMYLTFNQILYYSKGEPAMARSILENIYMIYMISDESAQGQVTDFFYYAYQTCYDALESDLDRQKLQDIKDDFERNRDDQSDRDALRKSE
ncbi:DUF2254 family protein [Streptococcus hyovaginalis]|uniref:DUF2254 family protein n=1 Tax=Streptococcus hyovaginalis TaxID=149015 RepID=UPI002A90A2C1|nr:DUF2254 family protein [Streptococcus hyovaginalis]MDY5973592.1 DUF2254 family protein [Streptococcus hyovaginalis]